MTYQYNGANELIRENNGFTNQTMYCNYLRIVRGIEREEVFKPVEKNFLDSSKRS